MNAHTPAQRYIEVFLVFDAGQKQRQADFNTLFTKAQMKICQHIRNQPIFLHEDKALHYMHFVDPGHCIIRAFVLESAIEGHFDELSLKKDSLTHTQIHGCYPNYAKGNEYINNPAFDKHLLALAISTEKEDLL
ncbi:MAG: hypothetical protein ACK4PR_02340 [Gammaproteobacteria bacterium]